MTIFINFKNKERIKFVNYFSQSSGLAKSLPSNVQILTLEPWKGGSVLLRLEHIFESGESGKYSIPVDVNIQVNQYFFPTLY